MSQKPRTDWYHLTDYGIGHPALCGEPIDERPVDQWPISLLLDDDSIFADVLCPMCIIILWSREGETHQ
jgi:hypothetical protein